MKPAGITHLIAAAGLSKQHTCFVCGALLDAFGRENDPRTKGERWVCEDHREHVTDGPPRVIWASKVEPRHAS